MRNRLHERSVLHERRVRDADVGRKTAHTGPIVALQPARWIAQTAVQLAAQVIIDQTHARVDVRAIRRRLAEMLAKAGVELKKEDKPEDAASAKAPTLVSDRFGPSGRGSPARTSDYRLGGRTTVLRRSDQHRV